MLAIKRYFIGRKRRNSVESVSINFNTHPPTENMLSNCVLLVLNITYDTLNVNYNVKCNITHKCNILEVVVKNYHHIRFYEENSCFFICFASRRRNFLPLFWIVLSQFYYASPTSGEAYRDRRLTTNFELWVEIFCVPTCFHMRIPKPCLSVCPSVHLSFCPHPEKRYHLSFVNISPTLVIDTLMERSSRVLHHGNPKIWFFFSKKFQIRILTFDEELKSP